MQWLVVLAVAVSAARAGIVAPSSAGILPGAVHSTGILNSLYPPQSSNYNELNKDIISRHRQFRVLADEDFQYRCLEKLNNKRRLHQSTRPLTLGYNFTKYTVERANSILRDIENKQDITKGRYALGESFFWYYDPNRYRSVDDAVNTWYAESRLYDYNRPGFSAKTGGFTQLVWKSTREVSCAKIEYETREHYKTLVVCNFYPAGNVNGEFPYNVMPRRGGGGGGGHGGSGGNRPTYPEDDYPEHPSRPSRPSRPDNDDPRPGKPRPPYDDPEYDRPSRPSRPDSDRPNRPGGGDGGYPTHPISITGSQETIITSSGVAAPAVPSVPAPVEPAQTPVLIAQVAPAAEPAIPVQYADSTLQGQQPQPLPQAQQLPQAQVQAAQANTVYEPVEAILVLPQYGHTPQTAAAPKPQV